MVRRYLFRGALAALALLGARGAVAGQIKFTGDVERDFVVGQPGVGLVVDNPDPLPMGVVGLPNSNPNDVSQSDYMSQRGWISGINVKDLRVHYDKASDSLAVGVNFFGIAGDMDGNGNPGGIDPELAKLSGGFDAPRYGGRETLTVAFDLNHDKVPDIVAGIPVDKVSGQVGPGIDGFNISKYVNRGMGLGYSHGETLYDHFGGLAFDPDQAHPDFEFLITNFSKINVPGFDFPDNGFGIQGLVGALDGYAAGEDTIKYNYVSPATIVPEPAALLGWSAVMLGGAAWGLGRRRWRRSRAS